MHSITSIIKRFSLCTATLVLGSFTMLGAGGAAFADDTPPPCVAPADSTYGNGVHHPVGADASMYTYDCDTATWVSQYYTFYPVTINTVPNFSRNYGYDCASGKWYMDDYYFSATDNSYHYARVLTSDPGLPTGCPAPVTSIPSSDGAAGDTGISNTGPGSSNTTDNTATLNGNTTNNTGITLNNGIYSDATSGSTFVIGNTSGGSATSGNAQSVANIANLLQSTSNAFGPGTTMFTANINGDVNGDFMFDPSAILNTGPNSSNSANNNLTVNTTDTNNTNAQINNTIDVGATSGNATVASNTSGGDATSGNAQAVVNLMNLINSTVASGDSFIGTININGDLNGDILLPQGVLDQLLASTGPNSSNSTNNSVTDNSTTTNNTTEGISNTIGSSALTGNADVSGNTKAGSATTGSASTGITVLNLTGSNTIGKNDLLVFVNVLGKWVGMIMNAPAGSTAASLGGGITSTGPNSTNNTNNNVTDNSTTTNNTSLGINNNVNVHAQSGDATVSNNTSGGSAKSGDASTAVNILNLEGSNLSLSNWFGVLFINVFGIWNGSFGVNTSAGDPISNPTENQVQAANQQSMVNAVRQFATFNAHTAGSTSGSSSDGSTGILGSATSVAKKIATDSAAPTPDNATYANFLLPIVGVCLAGAILIASERGRFFGSKKN